MLFYTKQVSKWPDENQNIIHPQDLLQSVYINSVVHNKEKIQKPNIIQGNLPICYSVFWVRAKNAPHVPVPHTYSKAVVSQLVVRMCDIVGPVLVICQCYKADLEIRTHTIHVSEKNS